jgi:pimeloyl-ACP methyl ester carboxylesterase
MEGKLLSLQKTILLYTFAFFAILILGMTIAAGKKFYKPPPKTTSRDLFTTVMGEEIRYRVHGSGEPTIIFLHGFGGALTEWRKIMPKLPNNRTIALDLLGFGGSDRPSISYDLETQRKYLVAFMKELKIKQAVLAGRSMGASIAAWTASKSQEKILGLILIAPSAYPGSLTYPWPLSWVFKPGWWNRIASICVDNSIFRRFFPYSQAPQAISVTRSYDNDFADALRAIRQPTLLIWSRGDKTVPFKFSVAYRERIPDLEFVEIPASIGHGVTGKYHDELINIIDSYLDKF